MAAPVTEKFEQMRLEVSENGTTWAMLCGLVGVTISRTAQFDSTEVPADCADESLPLRVEKAIRTVEVSVSADGVWERSAHETVLDWFYSGASKYMRLGHLNVLPGNTEYESGMAFLSSYNNQRTKGQKVTAALEFQFDGTPARIVKA